ASRADWTAGSKSAIRTAMIAMTTSSSINVKPRRFVKWGDTTGVILLTHTTSVSAGTRRIPVKLRLSLSIPWPSIETGCRPRQGGQKDCGERIGVGGSPWAGFLHSPRPSALDLAIFRSDGPLAGQWGR